MTSCPSFEITRKPCICVLALLSVYLCSRDLCTLLVCPRKLLGKRQGHVACGTHTMLSTGSACTQWCLQKVCTVGIHEVYAVGAHKVCTGGAHKVLVV